MDAFSTAVRNDPLSYLPEVSLGVFSSFRRGYDLRCRMESRPHDWGLDFLQFASWVQRQFGVLNPEVESAENVILSFAGDEEEAFYKYFEMVDEFSSVPANNQQTGMDEIDSATLMKAMVEYPARCVGFPLTEVTRGKKNLIEVIKAIREDPSCYLGFPSFRRCCAFIMGDERATQDLDLPMSDDRTIFNDFKKWVEVERNQALPRTWYEVIVSVGAFFEDCGHGSVGAFSHFYDLLDIYAKRANSPDLFRVPMDWRDWQQTNRSS